MAVPVSKFTFLATGLSVAFTDKSSNTPTSPWAWDFGDSNTDTVQNPTNVYAADGAYTVKLTAQNSDGVGTTYQFTILVAASGLILPAALDSMIDCNVPAGIDIDPNCKFNSIHFWQLYLQPLSALKIADADVHDELKWQPLVNALIAQLVAYELILFAARQAFIGATQSTSGQGGPQLKKMVTGPSEAEWFNNSQFWGGCI